MDRLQSEQPIILRFKSGLPNQMRKKDFGKGPVDTIGRARHRERRMDRNLKRLALQIKSYFERGFRELEKTKHGEKEKRPTTI